jgi:hypothetical protein
MKSLFLILHLSLIIAFRLPAQSTDSPQTLRWALTEAQMIDSVLGHAIRSADQAYLLQRMLHTYFSFDLLVQSGLYCTEARAAAESGRVQSDLVNYLREKDLNSLMVRALEAQKAAVQLSRALTICMETPLDTEQPTVENFIPRDIIRSDAIIVEHDLNDGLSSRSVRILSQKIEHGIKILHEIEFLAASLSSCKEVQEAAIAAADTCSIALQSANWMDLNKHIKTAISHITIIKTAECN